MTFHKILLNCNIGLYTYRHNETLEVGRVVEVDFAGKCVIGIVFAVDYAFYEHEDETKNIINFYDILLPKQTLEMIDFVANYTLARHNQVLKMCLPFKTIKTTKARKTKEKPITEQKIYPLSPHQQQVVDALQNDGFGVSLIEGKTGSGKTQVYISQIAKILQNDASAQILVLIPEIGLSEGVFKKLSLAFGETNIALWNSSVYEGTKQKYYKQVYEGESNIVLGTRSALFLPFKNLKYIVVDEEHDQSYKQEEQVLYHARDMAIYRAKLANCAILLLSATPSVESQYNARIGKYTKFELNERFFDVEMPQIHLTDLRNEKLQNTKQIATSTIEAIDKVLKNGKQVLVFIQRRGYSPLLMCPSCWYKFTCPNCDVYLTYHQKQGCVKCHQCGHKRSNPKICPSCGVEPRKLKTAVNDFLKIGFGIERIEQELKDQFMFEPIITISSDTMSTPKKLREAVEQINNRQVSIIIGTQLISKGFHFKHVDLVCVLDADLGTNNIDFRGKERTYQLITQVAGRTGREINKGNVIIQTYNAKDKVLQAIAFYDAKQFYDTQIEERQKNELPPFTKQIAIVVSGGDKNQTLQAANILKKHLEQAAQHILDGGFSKDLEEGIETFVQVLGPAEAHIFYIKKKFRYRLLIVSSKNISMQPPIKKVLKGLDLKNSSITIKTDTTPFNFF